MADSPFEVSEPVLGFGLMRLPRVRDDRHLPIDAARVTQLVDRFIAAGGTYFDTAFIYGDGDSEHCARQALVRRYPRESFQLADKLPFWKAASYDDLGTFFDLSRRRCGVTYFDVYLLHSITQNNYEKADEVEAWRFLSELKEQGRALRIGFSFHDRPELLDQLLTEHPEIDVVQLQLNYIDWDDPEVQAAENYDIARKHGKQIIVMEPVKGGGLADMDEDIADIFYAADPDASPASWAMRFAGNLENVAIVLSGMNSIEQLDDNLATFADFKPLTMDELDCIDEVKARLQQRLTLPCTGCRYCTKDCPAAIDIPEFLNILNEYYIYSSPSRCQHEYNMMLGTSGLPKDCIGCGQCEEACPQHLEIIEYLKELDGLCG